MFFAGRISRTSPGLDWSSLATPSHCRMESSRRRYRLESSFKHGFLPIHWRNDEKSTLICWAPQSLKSINYLKVLLFLTHFNSTLIGCTTYSQIVYPFLVFSSDLESLNGLKTVSSKRNYPSFKSLISNIGNLKDL